MRAKDTAHCPNCRRLLTTSNFGTTEVVTLNAALHLEGLDPEAFPIEALG